MVPHDVMFSVPVADVPRQVRTAVAEYGEFLANDAWLYQDLRSML